MAVQADRMGSMLPADPPRPGFCQRIAACHHGLVAADAMRTPNPCPGEAVGLVLDAAEMIGNGMRPGPAGDALACRLATMPEERRDRMRAVLPLLGLPIGATWSAGPDAADRAIRAMLAAAGGTSEVVDYGRAIGRMAVLSTRGIGLAEQIADLGQFAASWPQPQRIVADAAADPDSIVLGSGPHDGLDDAMVAVLGLLHRFGPLAAEPAIRVGDAFVALAVAGIVGVTAGHAGLLPAYSTQAEVGHRIDRIVARLAYLAGDGTGIPFSGWQRT